MPVTHSFMHSLTDGLTDSLTDQQPTDRPTHPHTHLLGVCNTGLLHSDLHLIAISVSAACTVALCQVSFSDPPACVVCFLCCPLDLPALPLHYAALHYTARHPSVPALCSVSGRRPSAASQRSAATRVT